MVRTHAVEDGKKMEFSDDRKGLHQARGARTEANATEELSGSPSAGVSGLSAVASSSSSSANLLAASPVIVGVAGAAWACQSK